MTIVVFITYAVFFETSFQNFLLCFFQILNLLFALYEYKYWLFQNNYSCFIIMQQKYG